MHCRREAEIWYVDCSHKYKINQGVMVGGRQPFDGRQPLVEDDRWGKTTLIRRHLLVEEDLCWKMTFGGRRPSVEDELCWRMTFGGRQPSLGDNLGLKTTFSDRRPSVEDNLRWKTTFSERRPSVDPCLLPSLLYGIFATVHLTNSLKMHSIQFSFESLQTHIVSKYILAVLRKNELSETFCVGNYENAS